MLFRQVFTPGASNLSSYYEDVFSMQDEGAVCGKERGGLKDQHEPAVLTAVAKTRQSKTLTYAT